MHIQLSTIFVLLALGATATAEEATILGTSFRYGTISQLHQHAAKLLKDLDDNIRAKRSAANNSFNPFREDAKKRLAELERQRRELLDAKWACPYWKICDKCKGGKEWINWFGLTPCPKCGGNNAYFFHESHPWPDEKLKCPTSKLPSTIDSLLGSPSPP